MMNVCERNSDETRLDPMGFELIQPCPGAEVEGGFDHELKIFGGIEHRDLVDHGIIDRGINNYRQMRR
jgi:hypothetical protein